MLAASGCGSTGAEHAGKEVDVSVRDFHIKAPKHVPTGDVSFEVYNRGPDHHELIVIRDDGKKLPLRGDALTVDEDGLGPAVAGGLEPQPPGEHLVSMRLKKGRYWLICNMSGHYLGGMDRDLEVR